MDFGLVLLVLGVIFVAELPDKSLFATLVLSTRYPNISVWAGACAAFFVHVIIAVAAARLLVLLPHRVLELVIGSLFLGGAALVIFGKHGIEEATHHEPKPHKIKQHGFWKVFATSFSIVFIGEWGDITQIATANYAAKYHDPWSVAVGAALGLWAVTTLAVFVGTKALTAIPPKILQRITASVLFTFAVLSLVSAFK